MDTCFEHWNSGRITLNADGHPDFAIDGPIAPGAAEWFALAAHLAETASARRWTLTLGGWVHPITPLTSGEIARRLDWLETRGFYKPVLIGMSVADRYGQRHPLRLPIWVNRRTGRSDMWHPRTGWTCGPERMTPMATGGRVETVDLAADLPPAATQAA